MTNSPVAIGSSVPPWPTLSFLRPVNLWPWPRRWSCSVLRTLATTSKLVQFCGLCTTSMPSGSGQVGAAASAVPEAHSHGPTSRGGTAARPSSSAPRLACRGKGSMPPTRKENMGPAARARCSRAAPWWQGVEHRTRERGQPHSAPRTHGVNDENRLKQFGSQPLRPAPLRNLRFHNCHNSGQAALLSYLLGDGDRMRKLSIFGSLRLRRLARGEEGRERSEGAAALTASVERVH
eukprot:scaffold40472_cov36-Phaeocystis_antarctica.AAC.4